MTKRDDERREAYRAKQPSPAEFDPDPGRARHARAMRRVYASELERATFYRDKYGVPFEPSELAGYRYRDVNGND